MLSSQSSFSRTMQLLMLSIVALGGMYARAELGPLQEAVKASLALSDERIALLQGPALAVPLLIGAIPLGLLIDCYSRKYILVVATLLNLLATATGGVAREFSLLLATRCAIGICAPATMIAAYSVIADIYSLNRRGRATSAVVIGAIAGTAGAFALGGELLATAGNGPDNWHRVMLWTACMLLMPLVLSMFLHEPARKERAFEVPSLHAVRKQFGQYWAPIGILLAGMSLVNLADGATLVWTAPTLSRTFGLSTGAVGAITGAAIFLSGIVGPLLGGPLTDFCQRSAGPRRTVLLLGVLALCSIPAGLFGAMSTIPLTVGTLILFLVLGNAIAVVVTALTISVIPNELRGVSMGLQWGGGALFGFGVAPIVVASLSRGLGGPAAIGDALAIVCATASLFGALVFICSRRMFWGGVQRELHAPC